MKIMLLTGSRTAIAALLALTLATSLPGCTVLGLVVGASIPNTTDRAPSQWRYIEPGTVIDVELNDAEFEDCKFVRSELDPGVVVISEASKEYVLPRSQVRSLRVHEGSKIGTVGFTGFLIDATILIVIFRSFRLPISLVDGVRDSSTDGHLRAAADTGGRDKWASVSMIARQASQRSR